MAEQRRIKSNDDAARMGLYAAAGGVALGAAMAVDNEYTKDPRGDRPRKIAFDADKHAWITLGLNSPAEQGMLDLAQRTGDEKMLQEYTQRANEYWDKMPIKQQQELVKALADGEKMAAELETIPKETLGAKWKRNLINGARKVTKAL